MYSSASTWTVFYKKLEEKALRLTNPATGALDKRYTESVSCPLCGSPAFSPRVKKYGFTYVTCNQCSFVYINPQLTQQAIEEVYNDEEVRRFYFEELLLPFVERDQKREFADRARTVRSLIQKPNARLLDIGCAIGNFMTLAKSYGFRSEGLELNQLYIAYAKTNRSVMIHQKLLEDMHYPDSVFDAVTLWDVAEHLPKPLETFKEIARVTGSGGIIGLTTINHNCFNEKILKERWRYYMPPDHLCSFTPALLKSMLNRCGLNIIKIQHHYMFEVFADEYFPSFSSSSMQGSSIVNKGKKVLYVVLAHLTQAIFNSLRSGDLLTVYARKS